MNKLMQTLMMVGQVVGLMAAMSLLVMMLAVTALFVASLHSLDGELWAIIHPLIIPILVAANGWVVYDFVFKPVRNLILRDKSVTVESVAEVVARMRAQARAEAEE